MQNAEASDFNMIEVDFNQSNQPRPIYMCFCNVVHSLDSQNILQWPVGTKISHPITWSVCKFVSGVQSIIIGGVIA